MIFDNISRWLLYIKFFFKNATKKDRFHIHLIDRPLILCFNGKYNSDGIHPCYKRKGFIIIYTILLRISFGNLPCLVFFKFFFFIQFGLIDPFDSNISFYVEMSTRSQVLFFSIESISSLMAFTHCASFTPLLKDVGWQENKAYWSCSSRTGVC